MRLALIADSHLSIRSPECAANWHAVEQSIAQSDVDATVHLGDLSFDGEHDPSEFEHAAELLEDWPTPIRVVPGNHDVGSGCGEAALSRDSLRRFRRCIGSDWWAFAVQGWWLVGVNAQLFASGTDEEQAQWAWLDGFAQRLSRDDKVVLFTHRPMHRPEQDALPPPGRYLPEVAATRLVGGPLWPRVRLVVSGHVHQALRCQGRGRDHLWVPSCAFLLPDAQQPRVGIKAVGCTLLDLSDDRLPSELRLPPAVRPLWSTSLAALQRIAPARASTPPD